ncbi:uracil-DNA glycosylase family protein [Alkalicaulis satelles]|uniref:Uracil-DNA glycosylase family protein n=1 Tax=Alkalicaulis satelles TaxID=2609175 RepID=A0A5M6ZAH4_9PROT|nr:uracil-DNA glycosylase family protein [Alkalicaulis satelles]KAA5801709.1 uracil-DNA glycosylase family protein [Alkalicaulis satelles]
MPGSEARETFEAVLAEARDCRVCQAALAHPCRPVVQGASAARIRIIGQAPGVRVQASGRPFTDPSGDRLRDWMGVSEAEFYDGSRIAITPMGLCFPGLDSKGADRPPRRECAPLWQDRFTRALPDVRLTLLVGAHAQRWHLGERAGRTLTQTVLHWRMYLPDFIAMPHPSWRNNSWLARNPWFDQALLPWLRIRIRSILDGQA